jgi:hypothetical protein
MPSAPPCAGSSAGKGETRSYGDVKNRLAAKPVPTPFRLAKPVPRGASLPIGVSKRHTDALPVVDSPNRFREERGDGDHALSRRTAPAAFPHRAESVEVGSESALQFVGANVPEISRRDRSTHKEPCGRIERVRGAPGPARLEEGGRRPPSNSQPLRKGSSRGLGSSMRLAAPFGTSEVT